MKDYYDPGTSEDKGTRRPTKTRKEILYETICKIDSEKNNQEKEKALREKFEEFGPNGERMKNIINQGVADRMKAVLYNPQKYDNPKDQNCYAKGFYENGSRVLYSRLGELSDKELKMIGCNDYYSKATKHKSWNPNGIICKGITANDSYVNGLMSAILYGTRPEDFLDEEKKPNHR